MNTPELLTCQEVLHLTGIRSSGGASRRASFPRPLTLALAASAGALPTFPNGSAACRCAAINPRLAGSGPQKVPSMSICSRIKSALRRRGLIIKFVRSADAARIGELVDLICQRNQDGSALRYALRHWRSGERPVVERFAGHATSLEVEGPCFMSDGRGYHRVTDKWLATQHSEIRTTTSLPSILPCSLGFGALRQGLELPLWRPTDMSQVCTHCFPPRQRARNRATSGAGISEVSY
jgi:hypothetical protein